MRTQKLSVTLFTSAALFFAVSAMADNSESAKYKAAEATVKNHIAFFDTHYVHYQSQLSELWSYLLKQTPHRLIIEKRIACLRSVLSNFRHKCFADIALIDAAPWARYELAEPAYPGWSMRIADNNTRSKNR